MELLNKETIESIYEKATDILANVGVEFDLESAAVMFKKSGAKVEGKRIFISPSLLKMALDSLPRIKYTPKLNKRLVAASPFSNTPMIIDDITGKIRRGNILDAIKSDKVAWKNYQKFSSSYQRIRIAYIDGARKHPEEFARRLANFIEKTRQNKKIGYGGIEKYY